MENSLIRHRLYANDVFDRPEELNPKGLNRVVYLAVEGVNTEPQYFEHLNRHMMQNENTVFRIEVLERMNSDGHSAPEHVIELLNEYMELRDGEVIPKDWMSQLEERYSKEVIIRLLRTPDDVPNEIKTAISTELLADGIDLRYRRYLKGIDKNDDDIIAAVVDRDGGGKGRRTRESLEVCVAKCEQKGYELYLTNPCFEFWLLLHLCDVKTEYAERLAELKENAKVSNKHTVVSREVSIRAKHSKDISKKVFEKEYLHRILQAVGHSRKFATELPDILDNLGTNLPVLLCMLGFGSD